MITIEQQHNKKRQKQTGFLSPQVRRGRKKRPCDARILSAEHPFPSGCGEEYFKVRQSAGQLEVQKNVLRIGFDSSTENQTFFKPFFQKNEVAPFTVKNQNSNLANTKKACKRTRNLYDQSPSCGTGGVNRYAIAILFHALIEATAAVRNASSLSPNSVFTAA